MKLFSLLIGLTIATASFAASGDPAAALKAITDYRVAQYAEAQKNKKPVDNVALSAKLKAMAKEAVKGVESDQVEPKQGYAYAQLFQIAGQLKDACNAATRFLTSGPSPEEYYRAQNLMLNSCNDLGEGAKVMELIRDAKPVTFAAVCNLASMTAYVYGETIQGTIGDQAALATLRLVESNVRLTAPTTDQEKAQRLSTLATVFIAKAELLDGMKKRDEALAQIDSGIAEIGKDTPAARGLTGMKKRMTLIGMPAPALNLERSHGEFAGIDSLKGNVVILDFFAHWCGPCIASFPDMKQLYADYKDKGLRVVGITTYYGYYKTENTQKRDMPKDTEFAKMGDFIKDYALPWPVAYGDRTNFDAFGVTGIPHVVVIDRKGAVHKIHVGYSKASFEAFRKEVEVLIAEK